MEAWKKENGMTILAQISAPLLSASGQFRWGKLQTHIRVFYWGMGWRLG